MKGKVIYSWGKYNKIVEYKGDTYLTVKDGEKIKYTPIGKKK